MQQSPMNRPYSELAGSRGSLANRPAVPVGRGGLDLNRIAEQRFRQSGNPSLLFRQQYFNQMDQFAQRGRPRGLPPLPLPASAAAPSPPDFSALPPEFSALPPEFSALPPEFSALPQAPARTAPAAPTAPAPAPLPPDFSNLMPPLPPARMPDGALDVTQPLPPSTLNGGAGLPPPPALEFRPLPGNPGYGVPFINGEPQKQFLPMPPAPGAQPPPVIEMLPIPGTNQYVPMYGDKPLPNQPAYTGEVVPGSYVRRETQGRPAPMQYTPNLPQPTERVTINADGEQTRTFTQPRSAAPAAAASSPAATAPRPSTTPGGVKVEVKPRAPATAEVLTGQIPNVAYANDLTPEQSLQAARAEYLRTGSDAALQEHFKRFPSATKQLYDKEAQAWKEVGQQIDAYRRGEVIRSQAIRDRNQSIDKDTGGNAFVQGASAERYARNNPGRMKIIDAPFPTLDPSLIEYANSLNKIAQARREMNLP